MEPTFTPHHSLDSNVLAQLARLLNVVAYNAPDAPYVPLLHPIAGLLLEAGLTEEEVDDKMTRSKSKCSNNTGPRGLLRFTGTTNRVHICHAITGGLGNSTGSPEAFGQVSV